MTFMNTIESMDDQIEDATKDTPRAGIADFLAQSILSRLPKTESGMLDKEEAAFQVGSKLLEMGRAGGRDVTGMAETEIFADTVVRGLSTLVPALTAYSRELKKNKETREDGSTLGVLLGLVNGLEMPEKMSSWLSSNITKKPNKKE